MSMYNQIAIQRAQPSAAPKKAPILIEYPAIPFKVKEETATLRMTPVGGGINRIAHLPKGTVLFVNGEKGEFYRVYLNSKFAGWVIKSDLEGAEVSEKSFIKSVITKEDKNYCVYEFELSNRVPFSLREENGLNLQIFNVSVQNDDTYCLNIPVDKLIGYDIYYDENKLVIKVRKPLKIKHKKPLDDIVIGVDAGHGGSEFGAIGCCGHKEKDINLVIAKYLKEELKSRGAKIVMTRDEDFQISLQDRVKIAKEKEAVLLLSIHSNALPDGKDPVKNRGTSVYYYHNQAKQLADTILDSMTQQLNTQNDKVRQGSLALVRSTSSVSVLIEVAYMINPDDYALLLDNNFQKNCAKAIADGIEKYILESN